MTRTLVLALVLVASSLGGGSAFAATSTDGGFSPDGIDAPKCTFVAETGGYQCEPASVAASLSEDVGGRPARKKVLILGPVGYPGIVQLSP